MKKGAAPPVGRRKDRFFAHGKHYGVHLRCGEWVQGTIVPICMVILCPSCHLGQGHGQRADGEPEAPSRGGHREGMHVQSEGSCGMPEAPAEESSAFQAW